MTPGAQAADGTAAQHTAVLEGGPRVSRITSFALAAAVAIVVGVGVWGLSAPRGGEPERQQAAVGESLRVPGGLVRVEEARNTSLTHRMPGMDFAGQQEPGKRRYAVTVTLVATGSQDIAVDPAEFLIDGDGVSALVAFENDLGTRVVPRGTQLSFTLVYQVPEAAESLALTVPGAADRVALRPGGSAPAGPQHGH